MPVLPRRIPPRRPTFDFADVPRHWFANNAAITCMANGVNVLFPAGERFFVRSVRYFADRIVDPELREQVRGFYAQESRHAHAHEAQLESLEAQGYRVRRFVELYEKIAYEWIEPNTSPELRLAVTAAAEHFTATMANNALTDRMLELAHPTMRDLLFWHACEEIEHKAVAFDVLRAVNPSYALRMAGLAIASIGLGAFWMTGSAVFMLEDARMSGRAPRFPPKETRPHTIVGDVFLKGLRSYARRDFHPLENDDLHLAHEWLASAGMLDAGARSAAAE